LKLTPYPSMKHFFTLAAIFLVFQAYSQTGTSISGVINIYTPVSAVNPCNNSITVGSVAGFSVGDRVLLIQMKGATIDVTNTATFGNILSYGGAGTYEFGNIAAINGTTIQFVNRILYTYTPASIVQLIRVPQYVNAIVSTTLSCQPWNGTTGGILALDVSGSLYLNANIDVSNNGFAGGAFSTGNGGCHIQDYVVTTASGQGAYKGEGIVVYSNANGGRGKLADGGGAGDMSNAGGAGGGNFNVGGNGGDGCQGCCGTSAGTGGIGGAALSYNQNSLFPGGGGGGGQQNDNSGTNGGNGGGIVIINANAIVASATDSIIASGQQGGDLIGGGTSDGEGGGGAAGTVVINAQSITGGVIPVNVQGGKGGDNHRGADGPGGGGAGGAVLLNSNTLASSLTIDSAAGIGGYNYTTGSNQNAQNGQPGGLLTTLALQQETQPWHAIDTPVIAYNSPACSGNDIQFTLTGSYSGSEVYSWTGPNAYTSTVRNPLITNATVANSGTYSVFVTDAGCTSPTVNLPVTVYPTYAYSLNINLCTGTVFPLPNGQIISSAGTYIDTLTTMNGCDSIITLNVTYASVHATGSTAICRGQSAPLNATGALFYSWSPSTGLSNASIANPVATPATTTTYTVTGSEPLSNLIVNGDFSMGNVGFSSGYAYTPPPNTAEGQYWVSTSATPWNGGMASCGDHTTGTGNMLLVNGATTANVSIWCETINVAPNTNYAFSTWLATLTATNPAQLQFSINGALIGPVFTASPTNCVWQQFYSTWNSGANTTASICIVNQNTVASGNDFAIDDISFTPLCQTSDSVTITVHPIYANTVTAGICNGTSYTLPNGTTATTTGTYIDTLPTIYGCDSIITTNLTVHQLYSDSAFPIICPFDLYSLPDGTVVHTSGIYTTHFTSIYGCDSNVITNLTVIPSTLVAGDDTAICLGDSAQLFASGSLLNSYSWAPAAGLSDSTVANPKASPLQTTTYVVTSQIGSGNLVFNGDFSQGNVGFNTAYNYDPNLVPEGNYYVGANPTTYHGGFSSCPDHTTGTGNQMIINGASAPNTNVWCQTVSVSPNTNYTFIAWGQSVTAGNPAQLQFSINGGQIGPVFNLPGTTCQWSQFFTTWNSGNNTTANICILDQQTAPGGNDFAIDDISFVSLCTAYDSVTVVVHHPDTIVIDTVICQGPTYTFPDGTTATASTNDTAHFSNQFGCDSTIITLLTVHPTYTDTIIDTICFGTSYTLPTGTVVNTTGTYTDTLPTIFGCDSIIITQLTVTAPPVTVQNDTICMGYTFIRPSGLTTQTAGQYIDTVTTNLGCDSVVITNLTVTPPPVTIAFDTICQGNTYTRPSGISVSTAGQYVDTLITAASCDSVIITNLTVNPTSATTTYDTICTGSGFTLGNGTVVTTAGSYPVTLPNRFGCDSVSTTILTVITVTVTATETDESCYGLSVGSITANASGGVSPYTYSLLLGSNTVGNNSTGAFNQLAVGNYEVSTTDNFGCSGTTNIAVHQPDSLILVESTVDVTCFGAHNGQITMSATGGTLPYTFVLNNQSNLTGAYSGLDTGRYVIGVVDNHGCSDSTNVTISQPQPVFISVSPDSLFVNLGKTIQLFATSNYDPSTTYLWSPSFGLSCSNCPDPVVDINNTAQYTVQVTANINGNNCMADTSITVTVIPDYDIFIPNVFTPNNDGKNDFFQIFGNLPALKYIHVMIFDRIGEKVFESEDINFKWDGTFKGQLLPPTVYVYTFRAVFDDDHTDKLYNGSVTLLR